MTAQWAEIFPDWVTPELALDDWRRRIDRVAAEEAEHFAKLPYVRGLAVIGSVGRGNPWPWSDIDMLPVADSWQGTDPEDLLRDEEQRRNKRLCAAKVPNTVEVAEWSTEPGDVTTAVTADDDAFFKTLEHPHWLGIVIKSQGARVVSDFDGQVARFLERGSGILFGDRFRQLWMQKVIDWTARRLGSAAALVARGDCAGASLEILRATYQDLASGFYAAWGRLPQSACRAVSRFLAAAGEAGDREIQELYLAAARLSEEDVRRRFEALPPQEKRLRDVLWAIRRGAGEAVDELAATRDLLNIALLHPVVRDDSHGPRPAWTGVTNDEPAVRAQLQAAEETLRRLRAAKNKLKGNS